MFEHFTFGAQAQSSFTPVEDTFPSPTDCSFTLEVDTSSCNDNPESESKEEMQDIVAQLSSHSLHPSDDELPQPSLWHTLTPDFCDEMTDFTPEELTFTSSTRGKVTISNSLPNLPISHPKHGTVANRRLQRQLNTQLQSCNTHMKDISSLVSNMISTSTQCVLHHPPSSTTSNPPFHTEPLELDIDDDLPPPSLQDLHEDEGFAEMEDEDTEMTLRRASTPSGIRKWNVRFRANGECVNGPPEAAWMGRRKVRCVPRMRRRRKPKVESVGE